MHNAGIFLAYQASRELETNFLALAMFGILTDFFFLSIQSLSHRNCQISFSFPTYFSLSVIYSTYTPFFSPSVRTEYFSLLSYSFPLKFLLNMFLFLCVGGLISCFLSRSSYKRSSVTRWHEPPFQSWNTILWISLRSKCQNSEKGPISRMIYHAFPWFWFPPKILHSY